jgi:DnaA family protein
VTNLPPLPRQIALDLGHIPKPSLDNFIATGNENLSTLLKSLQDSWQQTDGSTDPLRVDMRMIHAWGASGSGRTHILQAMYLKGIEQGIDAFLLNQESTPDDWRMAGKKIEDQSNSPAILCVDDIDHLDEFAQGALFRLHNLIKDSPKQSLITTSLLPPANLELRKDLRTRLAWGLVFQMHALSDGEKLQALQQAALARGLNLSTEVAPWLLRHFHRDMPSLMSLLEALDAYSLETKRAITLPLVKEMLAHKN